MRIFLTEILSPFSHPLNFNMFSFVNSLECSVFVLKNLLLDLPCGFFKVYILKNFSGPPLIFVTLAFFHKNLNISSIVIFNFYPNGP